MTGRISDDRKTERDHLEEAQVLLLTISIDLDEVSLRIRQAIRRTRIVEDVLNPAVERLDQVHDDLQRMQRDLRSSWEEGQRKKWKG